MGDDVWFISDHKLKEGVLLRNYKNTSTIRGPDKIYKINFSQVALKHKGVKNARKGLGVCSDSAGNSRRNGEKDRWIQPTERGKEKSSQVPKGAWAI